MFKNKIQKYYNDNSLFLQALKKENDAKIRFELNKKIIDFNEIPKNLQDGFIIENTEILKNI